MGSVLTVFGLLLGLFPSVAPVRAEPVWEGYIPISDKYELNAIRQNVEADYYLTDDIVFDAADFEPGGPFYNGGRGWIPIETFQGVFDGNGHAVIGLKSTGFAERSETPLEVGFIGYNAGTVRNLGFVRCEILAKEKDPQAPLGAWTYLGVVAGTNAGKIENCRTEDSTVECFTQGTNVAGGIAGYGWGTFSGCYHTGRVSVWEGSDRRAGGICGFSDRSLTDSWNTGTVEAPDGKAGGIAGEANVNQTLERCRNGGTVRGKAAGGIVGVANLYQKTEICYNTGTVEGNTAGGIAGRLYGVVRNGFNTGKIASQTYAAGGLAGLLESGGKIEYCYNIGPVSGARPGHIAGMSFGLIDSCYYPEGSLGYGTGGITSGVYAHSFQALRQESKYYGFDFHTVWVMAATDEGEPFRPRLRAFAQIKAESIAFVDTELRLPVGGRLQTPPAAARPLDTTFVFPEYHSLSPDILAVDPDGTVTGLQTGTGMILVRDKFTGLTATLSVAVLPGVTRFEIQGPDVLEYGQSARFTVDTDAWDGTIVWSADNPSVAVADADGTVTGVGGGRATVTARMSFYGIELIAYKELTVVRHPEQIIVTPAEKTLNAGESYALRTEVLPHDAGTGTVLWRSDNPEVASVDERGIVTAHRSGKAVITAETADGSLAASCRITVVRRVERIELNKTFRVIPLGGSYRLTAGVFPEDADNPKVLWFSDNPCVVVEADGTMRAVAEGSAVVTALSEDGGHTAQCRIAVGQPTERIELNRHELRLNEGMTATLTAATAPENALCKDVIWTSSNPAAVSVDSDGNLTALRAGTAVIRVIPADGADLADECVVTVFAAAEGISLNTRTLDLFVGQSAKLAATVSPEGADPRVSWYSDDPCVRVESDGTVHALASGTAVVTVVTQDGGFSDRCRIRVGRPAEEVRLSRNDLDMVVGMTDRLQAKVLPADALYSDVRWFSSDESVVTVDGSGNLRALKPGTAVLTAVSAEDDRIFDTCRVTVYPRRCGRFRFALSPKNAPMWREKTLTPPAWS